MAKKPKKSRAVCFQVLTTIKWTCGETVMLCPICRFAYVHLREIKPEQHARVNLGFWCENGHNFSYEFRFNKGNMIVSLQTSESEEC